MIDDAQLSTGQAASGLWCEIVTDDFNNRPALFLDRDGVIVEPRVGVGGAEARPRRMAKAEALLAGQSAGTETFRAAAEAAADAIDPLEDVHADAAFRLDLVRAVTRRALEQALG